MRGGGKIHFISENSQGKEKLFSRVLRIWALTITLPFTGGEQKMKATGMEKLKPLISPLSVWRAACC
jgi:hypothetical protein